MPISMIFYFESCWDINEGTIVSVPTLLWNIYSSERLKLTTRMEGGVNRYLDTTQEHSQFFRLVTLHSRDAIELITFFYTPPMQWGCTNIPDGCQFGPDLALSLYLPENEILERFTQIHVAIKEFGII